jgi:small redox-active disulfide protein 2
VQLNYKKMNDSNNNEEIKKFHSGNLGVANMEIKVLGPGCPKCKTLEKATRDAIAETGVTATLTKVEDIVEIMNFGVMTTPALVINGKVVIKGRVPSIDEIKSLITK